MQTATTIMMRISITNAAPPATEPAITAVRLSEVELFFGLVIINATVVAI